MKRSRILTIMVLVLILLLPQATLAAEGQAPLKVASLTKMSGNFTTGMWGNNTADIDVRLLIHGYPTVYESVGLTYEVNETAVRSLDIIEEPDGSKTFHFTLQPDLRYNDGSPIRAQDYVFAALFLQSSYIHDVGGSPIVMNYLKGSEAYAADPTIPLSGVRLINDLEFSLTVTADSFPNPKELHYVELRPYPYQVIAPGATIEDDGEGAYVKGDRPVETLTQSLLNPDDNYLTYPKVTSGPYSLISFDKEIGVAELEINPYFKGDPYGQKPSIERLTYSNVLEADIVPSLLSGRLDLVNKVSSANVIGQAATSQGLIIHDYTRNGMAFLSIATERPLVSTPGVRKAIAESLDMDRLIASFLGERGQRVYGLYGQTIALAPEWQATLGQLPFYQFDKALAIADLTRDGFIYNEQGRAYDEAVDSLRYRLENPSAAPDPETNKLIPLQLSIGITPENEAANLVVSQLERNLPQIGATLDVTFFDMPGLLQQFYSQSARTNDLYFLGSNFGKDFAGTSIGYAVEAFQHHNNPTAMADPVMAELSRKLRITPQNNLANYQRAWLAYQSHLVDNLPIIPLYTNTYSDIYSEASGLTGYTPPSFWSWAETILYASK